MTAHLDDTRDIRDGLDAQALQLVTYLLGTAPNRALSNRTVAVWGNKGSFVLTLSGKWRGRWVDWENGDKGDLFDLIRREHGGDFAAAKAWARQWLGWGDGPPPPPRKSDQLRREREERAARAEAEAAQKESASTSFAQRLWAEAGPVAGSVGERYLRETRRIVNSQHLRRWPDAIRWHDARKMLVFAVTDDAGAIVAVQVIRINADAKKDDTRGLTKQSYGPVGKGAVRFGAVALARADMLPPLQLAEGPETALTVWAATGFETWAMLGSMAKALLPRGRLVVVCKDDDQRMSNSAKAIRKAVRAWIADKYDVREVSPYEVRRQDKSDFNDLAIASGIGAVRERIEHAALYSAALSMCLATVDEARERIDARVGEFFDEVLARPAEMTDKPHVHAMGVTVGVGKSEGGIKHSLRCLTELRGRGDKRVIGYAVPEHRLSDEIVERFNAMARKAGSELRAAVYRGREALLPGGSDGEKMCADIETVREAQQLRADIDAEVCKVCPKSAGCAYLAQRDVDADLLVFAHPMIFHRVPALIKREGLAALIIDENPIDAGLVGVDGDGIELPLDVLRNDAMPVRDDNDGAHLAECRARLLLALDNSPDGPVRREAIVSTFIDYEQAGRCISSEWDRKINDGPWREREPNRTLGRMDMVWRAVRELVMYRFGEDKFDESGWLTLATNKEGVRVLRLAGRSALRDDWQVPTLIIDALLDVDLLRFFWPAVQSKGQIAVHAPHQTIVQSPGKSFAKNHLTPSKKDDEAAARAKAKALRNLRAVILRRQRQLGGKVLVVGNKAAVQAMGLPPDIGVAWFRAVAGRDQWKDVRLIVVVGRAVFGPNVAERKAGALTGRAPVRVPEGEWYPRGDAMRLVWDGDDAIQMPTETDCHPDPIAERIRHRAAVGEVIQAIGRGRGVNRDSDHPIEVMVLSDVVLPEPIDGVLADADLKPTEFDRQLAEGGVALTEPMSAYRTYPSLYPSHDAAKKALARSTGGHSLIRISIGDCPSVVVQRAGERQRPQTAYYDPERVSDPRSAIEAALGPLVRFEVIAGDEPAAEPMRVAARGTALHSPIDAAPAPIVVRIEEFATAQSYAGAIVLGVSETPDAVAIIADTEQDIDTGADPDVDWPAVRERLRDTGISHGDLAVRCGVSQPHLSNMERGFRRPTLAVAAALRAFLSETPPTQSRLL
jgi:putative DNA primase/helicase